MDTDGDFIELPGGGLQVVPREHCANGHQVSNRGWWICPRCGRYTRIYTCGDVHCGAWVTSRAHEGVCPP
jgi:hypothetical protein